VKAVVFILFRNVSLYFVRQIQTMADVNSLTSAATSPSSANAGTGADQQWDGVLRRQINVSAFTPSSIGRGSAMPAGAG
jgi:hypothetical protein